MATRGEDIVSILKQQIEQFGTAVTMVDVGTVIEVGDGIARIHGLRRTVFPLWSWAIMPVSKKATRSSVRDVSRKCR